MNRVRTAVLIGTAAMRVPATKQWGRRLFLVAGWFMLGFFFPGLPLTFLLLWILT